MKHFATLFLGIFLMQLSAQDIIYFGVHNTGALLTLQQYNKDTLLENPGLLTEMLLFEYNDSSRIKLLEGDEDLHRVLVIPGADTLSLSSLDELEESTAIAVILSVRDSSIFCSGPEVMASLSTIPIPVFVLDSSKVATIQNFLPSLVSLSRKMDQSQLLDTLALDAGGLVADVQGSDYWQLIVSPNPTIDFISYRLTIPESSSEAVETATISIVASDGRMMKRRTFVLSGSVRDKIPVNDLPVGMYQLVVTSKSHHSVEPFVIAR